MEERFGPVVGLAGSRAQDAMKVGSHAGIRRAALDAFQAETFQHASTGAVGKDKDMDARIGPGSLSVCRGRGQAGALEGGADALEGAGRVGVGISGDGEGREAGKARNRRREGLKKCRELTLASVLLDLDVGDVQVGQVCPEETNLVHPFPKK